MTKSVARHTNLRGVTAMSFRVCLPLTVVAAGIATWSCSGSPAQQPIPATIEIVSGNAQTGVVGVELASPLVVKVTDAGGVPVRGALVSFIETSGGGSPFAGSAITNMDGIAQDRWTLGTTSGHHEMEARVLDATTAASLASVNLNATAVAGPPANVSLVSGDGQVTRPGTALPMPLQARVTDAFGNPVGGAAVTFVANPADGAAMPPSAHTDATGSATVAWTLSTTIGAQTLHVTVQGAPAATFTATARPTLADTSDITVVGSDPGVTPFINFVKLSGSSIAKLTSASYTIAPKPGAVSKAVNVRYTVDALTQRRYAIPGASTLVMPIFGLYSGYANQVTLALQFSDDSSQHLAVDVTTSLYTDPNGVYDHPTILKSRAPGTALGFDFFFMKSGLGTQVVVDTDGEMRWVGVGVVSAVPSFMDDNAFIIGASNPMKLTRLELDGSMTEAFLTEPTFTNFHHNVDSGKHGWLAEFDASSGGVSHVESTLAEIAPWGGVLKEWDFEALLSTYMRSQGDDPTAFVRPGADWFHMNASTYDPSDDTLIVSSRENFVIKVDYATGDVKWILGDPTKYWYTFPSLRAKALALADGGLYPIGQHAVSITGDGLLLLFNNGAPSFNQPAGQPAGASRTYSAVSAYAIDTNALTAREAWRFDYDQTVLSTVCSSVYEVSEGSLLVSYAFTEGGTKARLVGLDSAHNVVFDFKYPSPSGCATSWNARAAPFDSINFH